MLKRPIYLFPTHSYPRQKEYLIVCETVPLFLLHAIHSYQSMNVIFLYLVICLLGTCSVQIDILPWISRHIYDTFKPWGHLSYIQMVYLFLMLFVRKYYHQTPANCVIALSNATEHISWWVNIGSGNGLEHPGGKPLPAPMLNQIYVAIWRY